MSNPKKYITTIIRQVLTEQQQGNKQQSTLSLFKKLLENIKPYISKIERVDDSFQISINGVHHFGTCYDMETQDDGVVRVFFTDGGHFLLGRCLIISPHSINIVWLMDDFASYVKKNPIIGQTTSNEVTIFKTFMNVINNRSEEETIKEETYYKHILAHFSEFLKNITPYILKIQKTEGALRGFYDVFTKDGGELSFTFATGKFIDGDVYFSNQEDVTDMALQVEKLAKEYKKLNNLSTNEEAVFGTFMNMINNKKKKNVVESGNNNKDTPLFMFKEMLDKMKPYVLNIEESGKNRFYNITTKDGGLVRMYFTNGGKLAYSTLAGKTTTLGSANVVKLASDFCSHTLIQRMAKLGNLNFNDETNSNEQTIFKAFMNGVNNENKEPIIQEDVKQQSELYALKEILYKTKPYILRIEKQNKSNYYNIITKDGGIIATHFTAGGKFIYNTTSKATLDSHAALKFFSDFTIRRIQTAFANLDFTDALNDETKSNEEIIFKSFANNLDNENKKQTIKEDQEEYKATPLALFKKLLDNIQPFISNIRKHGKSDMTYYIKTKDGGELQFSFFESGEFMGGNVFIARKYHTDMAIKIENDVKEFKTNNDSEFRWDKQQLVIFKTFINLVNSQNKEQNNP